MQIKFCSDISQQPQEIERTRTNIKIKNLIAKERLEELNTNRKRYKDMIPYAKVLFDYLQEREICFPNQCDFNNEVQEDFGNGVVFLYGCKSKRDFFPAQLAQFVDYNKWHEKGAKKISQYIQENKNDYSGVAW